MIVIILFVENIYIDTKIKCIKVQPTYSSFNLESNIYNKFDCKKMSRFFVF